MTERDISEEIFDEISSWPRRNVEIVMTANNVPIPHNPVTKTDLCNQLHSWIMEDEQRIADFRRDHDME